MAVHGNKINPQKFEKGQIKFYIILIPLALFMLLPIVFIINHAFKPLDELVAFPPKFFVEKPTVQNFSKLFSSARQSEVPLSRYIFNSAVVTGITEVASLLISSLAGFALSKMKFRLKKAIFEINNIALMFVPTAVMIPRYLTIKAVGILDTYWAHILPLLAMPVGIFLIKQFIDQIPDALIEAAVIDGASNFKVYRVIILPLIRPAMATAAILVFQQVWNNIETSNLYVTTEGMKTLAFYMNTLATQNNVVAGAGVAAAAGMIMFLPNLVLFIIMQSNVMNTMAYSGLK